jgi:hypothetical protein
MTHKQLSLSREAAKKRLYKLRRNDPENAPPKRRPGPAPGTISRSGVSARLCVGCGKAIAPTISSMDLEFVRRRLAWTVRKLATEIASTEDQIVLATAYLSARGLICDGGAQ